jgi:hypothetical protein
MKKPGWDTRHCGARGHGFQDNRPGSYDSRLTDVRAWQNDRPDADMGGLTDGYAASEEDAGRDMHVIANHAIVLNDGGCVHNAVLSDLSAGVDHNLRHDDGAGLKSG